MASVLDELEDEERKEKEAKAKQAKDAALRALAIHPLVNEKRDVRDAYFHGLAFAAIADDGKVDAAEKTILSDIAKSLGVPQGEVVEAVSELQGKSATDKMQLITECVKVLAGNKVGLNLFWAQFIQVWSSHADGKDILSRLLKRIAEQSGVDLPASKVSAILGLLKGGDSVDKDMLVLADWMGDDALKYFVVGKYGDVSETLAKARKQCKRKEHEAKRKKTLEREKERAHEQVEAVMQDVDNAYCGKASVYKEALDDITERVCGIDGDMIDWVTLVDDILKPVVVRNAYAYVARDKKRTKCRGRIWRLVVLLMIDRWSPQLSQMTDSLDNLLSAKCIDGTEWHQRLEDFIVEYLNDRVRLVDTTPKRQGRKTREEESDGDLPEPREAIRRYWK